MAALAAAIDLRYRALVLLAAYSGLRAGELAALRRHASAALTLDRYGHLMPGQERSVADRLDAMARQANPVPMAPVTSLPG